MGESTGSAFATTFRGRWRETAWQAVGTADATWHQVGTPGGGAFASREAGDGAETAVVEDEEPMALFWRWAEEEVAGVLGAF